VDTYQLRRISIICISILCLSPIDFFSNNLFENKKGDNSDQIVLATIDQKLEPNYLSNNYEIFNPNITATSDNIEKLVNENKKKEQTESENNLESETTTEEKEELTNDENDVVVENTEVQEENTSTQKIEKTYASSNETTVTEKVEEVVEQAPTAPQPNTDVATSLVNYAKQFVGNPYRSGGADLNTGVDCSGFTMKIYEQFGYNLPHSSKGQSSYGSYVSLDQLAVGDLIFYGYSGSISHVAIYIGNGQIVHAATSGSGIVIAGYQIMPIITARRILN